MKIIEKKGNTNLTYRVTCCRCRCVFRFDMTDASEVIHQGHDIVGGYVDCPDCDMSNAFYNGNIIDEIHEAAIRAQNEYILNG